MNRKERRTDCPFCVYSSFAKSIERLIFSYGTLRLSCYGHSSVIYVFQFHSVGKKKMKKEKLNEINYN